jgi:DNA-binding SARP family transcriptional activator
MVRVLGSIDVVAAGKVMSVGGHQPRALLGALVMSADHAVPIDHLRWVLWGDDAPKASDATLQSYVSHLRHLLGHDAVLLADHSYELDASQVDVDAIEFERSFRRAEAARDDPEKCWQLSRDALRLWRGRPFGELADEEPFIIEVRRLEDLRLATMEMSMEADLMLGRVKPVIGELEAAVAEHPYREHLWWLLIKALADDGRRVEALRKCEHLRRSLGEVGVGIGPEVAELEREILAGEQTGGWV